MYGMWAIVSVGKAKKKKKKKLEKMPIFFWKKRLFFYLNLEAGFQNFENMKTTEQNNYFKCVYYQTKQVHHYCNHVTSSDQV